MTELDELKQRLEIEELRGRLSAAEKQIALLTETLSTLNEIQTSDRLGSYINSQVRLIKAAEFLNSVSDGEQIDPQLQRQSAEQAGLRKAELDADISAAVQCSREQSLHTADSRIAKAVGNWQSVQPATADEQAAKLLTYRSEAGGLTITGMNPRRDFDGQAVIPEVLEIPAEINGVPVMRIGDRAFRGLGIQTVRFPEGLYAIGKDAFSGCEQLSSAAFPDSLMSIGAGAFASCAFRTLHLENTGVTVIPEKCFGWCSELKSLTLPEGLVSIENNAFAECRSLLKLIIPENTVSVVSPFSTFSGGERRSLAIVGMNTQLSDLCGIPLLSGGMFGGKATVQNLIVYCLPDSSAQKYCLDNGVPCRHLSEFPA